MSTEAGTGSQQSELSAEQEGERGPLSVEPASWDRHTWLGAIILVPFVLAVAFLPLAPNYDTATHLVWGQTLASGSLPTIDYLSAPTPHPLWLLFAMTGSAEIMQVIALTSLAVTAALIWRLAEDLAGLLAGVIATAAALSSFALLLLTFKSYVDVPFVALMLLALVWERQWAPRRADDAAGPNSDAGERADEVQRPRRRAPWRLLRAAWRRVFSSPDLAVPAALLVAGLLRPEAWAFGLLLVGSRLLRGAALRELRIPVGVVLAAPVLWVLFDWALTGNPFHSLTGTRELAEELGRPTGLARAPRELVMLLGDLARPPVAAAGALGIALLLARGRWREARAGLPLLLFAAACAGFLLVGALSLPLLQRYLLIASVLMAVFAGVGVAVLVAVALGKPNPLSAGTGAQSSGDSDGAADSAEPARAGGDRGPVRRSPALRAGATVVLLAGLVGGAGYLVLKAGSFETVARGALREATWQRQAIDLMNEQPVIDASRCGPVTLPTYRMVPEINRAQPNIHQPVVSRATTLGGAGPQDSGVAIVIVGDRKALTRLAYAAGVTRTTNTPPPGFTEIARRGPFVAYARCEN